MQGIQSRVSVRHLPYTVHLIHRTKQYLGNSEGVGVFFGLRERGVGVGPNCNDFPQCHLAAFQGFFITAALGLLRYLLSNQPGCLPVSPSGNSRGTGFNWGHPPWKRFPPLSREMEALNVMHIKTSSAAGQAQAALMSRGCYYVPVQCQLLRETPSNHGGARTSQSESNIKY